MINYIKNILNLKKYYFVSYSHKNGFGRAHIDLKGEPNIQQIEEFITKKNKLDDVVILYYKKVSKRQVKNELL